MYRQSSSRNQRSKGVRIKHVLQICLLLVVCFWLIYQVKHSHDKKKDFDESDAKALLDGVHNDELIKLGRKDIRPQVEGAISKKGKPDEPEEEEDEVEENRHEEDELGDKKVEAKEDKELGAGDDETDEHEPDKSDAEVGEEDVVDDDEKEGGDEIETQETDSEDGQGQTEKESSTEETDHDGDDGNTHEAREENYKADDASSAVTHNTPTVTSGNENELVGNSKGHHENIVEVENKENKSEDNEGEMRQDLEVEGEIARDDQKSNVITTEPKVDMLDNSVNGSSTNNTVKEGSDDHLPSDSSPDVTSETHDLSSQNVTESNPKSDDGPGILTEGTSAEGVDLQTIGSEQAGSSFLHEDSNRLDSNSTGSIETKDAESHSDEFSSSSNNNAEFSESGNISRSEASVEAGKSDGSTSEKNDEIEARESDKSDGIDEDSESTVTENPEEVHHDAIDISETDVRMDLETLPQIQTEGIDSEDAAAE